MNHRVTESRSKDFSASPWLCGCLTLCLCVFVAACRRPAEPPPAPAVGPIAGTLTLPGVSAPVRVVRDRWGVPHIYASTTDDLFFAQGFCRRRTPVCDGPVGAHRRHLAEVLGSNFIGLGCDDGRMQYRGDLNVSGPAMA